MELEQEVERKRKKLNYFTALVLVLCTLINYLTKELIPLDTFLLLLFPSINGGSANRSMADEISASSSAVAAAPTGSSSNTAEAGAPKKKRMFCKELRAMMYGFGDDSSPYIETVELIEDLVVDFIGDVTLKAVSVGKRGTVRVEDINYVIRNDVKKSARVRDLLMMNEELRRAKKKFEDISY